MTPAQQSALEALASRPLTAVDIAEIEPLLADRNDVAIAAVLSVGRKRLQHTAFGPGTIVVVFGGTGGQFLNELVELGKSDPDIYWGMNPIERGEFDLGVAASHVLIDKLIVRMPAYADQLTVFKSLGYVPDPVNYNAVSAALNVAEGRMTL